MSPQVQIAVMRPERILALYQTLLRGVEGAVGQATRKAGVDLRTRARSHTAAILGKRAGNVWGRPVYYGPEDNRGTPTMAATVVPVRGRSGRGVAPLMISAHESGGTWGPSRARRLAIPLPAAGKRGTGRFNSQALTPTTYEAAFGVKLQFRPLPGGRGLLMDPTFRTVARRGGGTAVRRATARQRERGVGLEPVAVFLLVPQVTLRKRLRLGEAVVPRSGTILVRGVGEELDRALESAARKAGVGVLPRASSL